MPSELQALWERSPDEALERALAAWRSCRAPALADLIGAWSARLANPEPSERTRAAFHERWLDAAASARVRDVPWLAQTVDHKVEMPDRRIHLAPEPSMPLARARALRQLPADPRITTGLLQALRRARIPPRIELDGTEVEPIYAGWVDQLVELRDVRALAELEDLLANPIAASATTRDLLARLLPPAIEALRAVEPEPAPDLPAPPAPQAPSTSLDAIYAAPHDLGLRAALADRLQEEGDPRGTFIALQLARDPQTLGQQRALLRAHRSAWLGEDLDAVLSNVELADGFLHAATMKKRPVDDQTPARAALDHRLSTLAVLRVGNGYGHHLLQLLTSPHLRTLHTTEANKRHVLDAMTQREPLSIETLHLGFPIRDDDRVRLAALRDWPRLRRVHLPLNRGRFAAGWAALERSRLLESLETLWIQGHPDPAAVLTPERVAPIRRLGVGTPEEGVLFEHSPGPRLFVSRRWSLPKLAKLARALAVEQVVFTNPQSKAQVTKAQRLLEPAQVVLPAPAP